jgi:hypothetical protein
MYFFFEYVCWLFQCLPQIIIACIHIWRPRRPESASYSGSWENAGHMIFLHYLCTRLQLYGHVKDLDDLHGDYGTLFVIVAVFILV